MEYLVASVTERSVAEPPKVKTETVVRVTRRSVRGVITFFYLVTLLRIYSYVLGDFRNFNCTICFYKIKVQFLT